MQQSLSNNLAQKQTLQLNSIQMQGLDVLQSNIQLLEQRINLEIVQNPLLEADYESPMHINDSTVSDHVAPNPDTMAALGDYDENLMPLMLHQNGQELGFETYAEDMYHRNWDASQEEKRRHLMDSITAEDHLPEFRQEIMASCSNDIKLQAACLAIIPLLDEAGYFPPPSDFERGYKTGRQNRYHGAGSP